MTQKKFTFISFAATMAAATLLILAGEIPAIEQLKSSEVTRNYNKDTIETAILARLTTYTYQTEDSKRFFFSVVPHSEHKIYVCSYTANFEGAWITMNLEGEGNPVSSDIAHAFTKNQQKP
ncbi:hypothetical protein OAF54_01340 [bacterium]|nr:hypothetical protein [bacterium]